MALERREKSRTEGLLKLSVALEAIYYCCWKALEMCHYKDVF